VSVQLPVGPSDDSFKLNLFVQIFDDSDAYATFYIPTPVKVELNTSLTDLIATDLLSVNSLVLNQLKSTLHSNNFQRSINTILSFATMVNHYSETITLEVNRFFLNLLTIQKMKENVLKRKKPM
jgi:hypothetical protein